MRMSGVSSASGSWAASAHVMVLVWDMSWSSATRSMYLSWYRGTT